MLRGVPVIAKERSSRRKLTPADAFMLPLYGRLLGIVAPPAGAQPYPFTDAITMLTDNLAGLLLARGEGKGLDESERAELLTRLRGTLQEDIDSTRADMRPLVWLTATTGAVPSSLPHEALDADAYAKRYGVTLDKAQREASFFVIGSKAAAKGQEPADVLVMAVVPEAQPYTVRIQASSAAED